jgi:hypothetical protein
MKPANVISALLLGAVVSVPASWAAEDAPRVVLLGVPDQAPSAKQVQEILAEQLASVGVRVDVQSVEEAPASTEDWDVAAREAAKQPGTLALIGWSCEGHSCLLTVVDTRSGAIAEVPVDPGEEQAEEDGLELAIASTSREAVIGSLLPELGRLTAEGEDPSPPPPTGDRVPQAYSPEAGPDSRGLRPWLWIEGGYFGEHPYPQGQPLHGPWLGLAVEARRYVVPALSVGWLGLQQASNEAGEVRSHRMPIAVDFRIAVPVGPATFSIAPVGRFDVVFVSADPRGPRGASSQVELELHVGGKTCWNLPLPGGIEIVVGAGILGTLLGHEYSVDDRRAIAESTLRFGWWVGVAWSPIG